MDMIVGPGSPPWTPMRLGRSSRRPTRNTPEPKRPVRLGHTAQLASEAISWPVEAALAESCVPRVTVVSAALGSLR